jgi:hypothetical protein
MPLSLAELEDFERFRQRWAHEEEAALEAAAGESPDDAGAAREAGAPDRP